MKKITRRELAMMLGAGAFAGSSGASEAGPATLRGVVGLAAADAQLGHALALEAARRIMAEALAGAVGEETGTAAAARLFAEDDVVGIKLNCLAGRNLSPRVELVEALVGLLAGAGVDRRHIIVFERSSRELERAGFTTRRQGPPYRCVGTDNDYERRPSTSGAIGSCFAHLVTTECTALVSFGVVKDHDLAGVSAGMKNWYGVIHNPNKYHDNGCDPYIVDVARHPYIRDKLRLTVLDGAVAQCHGGPAFRFGATFPLGFVAASTDPVAADLWAWLEIEAERKRRGMPTLEAAGRPARFLATAARHGLGVGDPDKLRLVTA